jgi:uncharacterized protein
MEVSSVAVGAIQLYRQYLSPRKGFRCAHNAVYGGGSCSDFGLRVFRRYSLLFGWHLLQLRFAACKIAHCEIVVIAGSVPDAVKRG